MLKKLRQKMIIINLAFVSVVMVLAAVIIGYSSHSDTWDGVYHELTLLADRAMADLSYQDKTGQPPLAHRESHVPYVSILVKKDGSFDVISSDEVEFGFGELENDVARIMQLPDQQGTLSGKDLAFYKARYQELTILVIRDVTQVRQSMCHVFTTIVILFVISDGLCLLLSLFTSSMSVKPIYEAWKQQNQFVANASHDLKTPLTVLLANAHIMASHPDATVAQQSQWLNSMTEEAGKMRRLIDDMLTLARAENSAAPPKMVPLHLSDLVEEEALFMEPVAYEKNVNMDLEIQKHIIWNSDRALIRKLVSLLVDNAIKYSSPGGTVTVCLKLNKNKNLIFSVRNFGTPISPEDMEHLFDRFYRSDKSRSTDGYGLGLAIAQVTARQLRGSISATSSQEDGTVFTVEFRPS